MCFEFGSCFGNSIREDYGGERTTPNMARGGRRRADRRNGYYSGTDDRLAPAANYSQPHATAEEAGHKAYHDGAGKADHGYPAYAYPSAADETGVKVPAWQSMVGDGAGYAYTAHLHQAAADRRENGAVGYHHYQTATTNTALARY